MVSFKKRGIGTGLLDPNAFGIITPTERFFIPVDSIKAIMQGNTGELWSVHEQWYMTNGTTKDDLPDELRGEAKLMCDDPDWVIATYQTRTEKRDMALCFRKMSMVEVAITQTLSETRIYELVDYYANNEM